ncbi:putative Exosome complex component RRP45B [Paratrimastix pyriformis]|uniref:Exosome complex component RRP45B n=1 Tax=Paratrimastix pyriformis TaxID=342808 RepID=A0ABQ8URL1_9EUKA|nr:putative Exosome complex component RRP45B [Paratrimastix pyriformis]
MDFLLAALKEGIRVDGRAPTEPRDVSFSFPHERGHAEVKMGNTRVLACISAEILAPYPDRPNEGILSFTTDFSPMASPAFEPGRSSERGIEISRVVERGIRETRAINMESLCILAGEKVWSVRCDLHVLDDGGNLMDCLSLAAMAAFLHFRKPQLSVAGDRLIVYPASLKDPVPLTIHHVPIAVTFGLFTASNLAVLDPTTEEEAHMDGALTVTINSRGVICAIQKAGGAPITQPQILALTGQAAQRAKQLVAILTDALKATGGPAAEGEPEWTHEAGLPSVPAMPAAFASGPPAAHMPALHTRPILAAPAPALSPPAAANPSPSPAAAASPAGAKEAEGRSSPPPTPSPTPSPTGAQKKKRGPPTSLRERAAGQK